MPKIRKPRRFSEAFNVSKANLRRLGAVDVFVNLDTRLFIDPLKLQHGKVPESAEAYRSYQEHFASVIKLLAAVRTPGDVAWKAAVRLLSFPEPPATCLGYGSATTHGSGFGPGLTSQLIRTAREIIDLGVTDPDLFALLALFEEDVGPDRISDMVTNVIMPSLAKYTSRVCSELGIPTTQTWVRGIVYSLPRNPMARGEPLVLVPCELVRPLPVAASWDEIADVVAHNKRLRDAVNAQVADLWSRMARKPKSRIHKTDLRELLFRSKESFELILRAAKAAPAPSYDFDHDPSGHFSWHEEARRVVAQNPLSLVRMRTEEDPLVWLAGLVRKIIARFRGHIEDQGLATLLYGANRNPQHETVAQKLFFAVADAYCQANDIDVTPEADTGTGAVDFKFSRGYKARVLVEIKLSRNTRLVDGYVHQLEVYKKSQDTADAFYLVVDVGSMGRKKKELTEVYERARVKGGKVSEIEYIDGTLHPSASKRS
ncbi:MAG: hypothetical protein AAB974_01275 [Patescibacteria group bacterium]